MGDDDCARENKSNGPSTTGVKEGALRRFLMYSDAGMKRMQSNLFKEKSAGNV
jgi:hypothetical protein